jgi:AraC family transcriptional regulator, positive regulator of tynA and feaB
MIAGQTVRHWSTSAIPANERLEFWLSTLHESLWPVSEWSDVSETFQVQIREAPLGPLTTVAQTITPHSSRRTRRDVERSAGHYYHLFYANSSSVAFSHRGRTELLDAGGAILLGAEEHETCVPQGFSGIVFKCPAAWLHGWVADPRHLVGQHIRPDSRWGRVLCPMLSQLTPEVAAAPPVPAETLVDHLGVVLALMGDSIEPRAKGDLTRKVREVLQERHTERGLTASDVADALNVPIRVLHRSLAAQGTTFLALLAEARR